MDMKEHDDEEEDATWIESAKENQQKYLDDGPIAEERLLSVVATVEFVVGGVGVGVGV